MNITSVSNTDLIKIISGNNNYFVHDDVRNIVNIDDKQGYIDSLELSQEYQNGYDTSNINSIMKYSANFSFKPKTDEELAEHIAGIGRRIDEAFGQGIFTKDEYDQLNAELLKYAETAIANNEGKRACQDEIRNGGIFSKSLGISMKELMDDVRKPVVIKDQDKYAKYRTNRDIIWEIINRLRYCGDTANLAAFTMVAK